MDSESSGDWSVWSGDWSVRSGDWSVQSGDWSVRSGDWSAWIGGLLITNVSSNYYFSYCNKIKRYPLLNL